MAARDPLWAIASLATGPFRAGRYMFQVGAAFIIVILVVGTALQYAMGALGAVHGSAPWVVGNWLFTIFALLILFRLITGPMIKHFGETIGDTHGSARFATNREIAPLTQANAGLLIGRDVKSGKLLRYDGPAHLLTMAPTRTGKGVGTIIPNLLTANRSVICIDPKGENAKDRRANPPDVRPVHVLDPFGATNEPTAAFNPLDHLDPEGLDVAEDASTLADALVYDEPGMAGEAHWNEEAKTLIAGIILHVVASEPLSRRTLMTLRENLTLAPDAFTALLKDMQASNAAVLSSAQRHTHFLDSPRMARVLDRSDVRFGDLKKRSETVFLVLPPDRLSTYSRWLRLLITQSLLDMARTADKPDVPVLYLLDEFAALGHLAPVERAMGLMAGYGVQLWPILQDVHQLRATYGRRAGTFLSNAGVVQVFGVNDHDSARLISDLLGQKTVVFQTMARALDSEKSGISYSQQHAGRPLLTPDEVRNLPQQAELLFLARQRPIVAGKLAYFTDVEFRETFDNA